MLKTKYERMNRKEKKALRIEYKKTEKGKSLFVRFYRLIIIGVIGIIYSFYLYFFGFEKLFWYHYIMIVSLFGFSCFFIFMSIRLQKKVLNQFAIKKK